MREPHVTVRVEGRFAGAGRALDNTLIADARNR
jgi:hypothetical protein